MAIFLKRLETSPANGGKGKFLRIRGLIPKDKNILYIYNKTGSPPVEVPATYNPRSPKCWEELIRGSIGKHIDPFGTWYIFRRGGSFTSWKLEKKNMKPIKQGFAKLLWKGEIN